MQFSRTVARWFPVPHTLVPHGVGVDITDASIKWLSLTSGKNGVRIKNYGSEKIPAGVVQAGAVRDPAALGAILAALKKKEGILHAHAALPEEGAFVFSMHVPRESTREHIQNMIEFELVNRVPIPPAQTVYDYDTVQKGDENGEEIAVTVFPREIADGYVTAFKRAGIELLSLEIEARSIARAVSHSENDPVTLLVDCGHSRTGVAILKHGIPIFTSTVDVGGDTFTQATMKALNIATETEAEVFKNEHGLENKEPSFQKGYEAVEKIAAQLAEEIARHHRFWDTRRTEGKGRTPPVERVLLLGGGANLRGLAEYIAGRVQAETTRPNVWRNLFSFDDYIPPIDFRTAFKYSTAIGLAMRSL